LKSSAFARLINDAMLTVLDAWVGKRLFVPLIVRFCQLTGQTQFAVSRLFWFLAALDGLYHSDNLLAFVIWGLVSMMMMVTASLRADEPVASFMIFRLLALFLLMLGLVRGAATGDWIQCEFWLLVLIAEYSATIRNVPPPRKPARHRTSIGAP
jgi:hypothetical protein